MKQRMNWESHKTGRQKNRVASRYWELFLTGWIFEGEIANYLAPELLRRRLFQELSVLTRLLL